MGKALVYRRGALGDTIVTFPLLEVLKRKGYEVTAVGNTDYFKIAKEVGWVDRVHYEILGDKYDCKFIISSDGNIKPFPSEREWIVTYYLSKAGFEREKFSKELPISKSENSPLFGKVVIAPSSGSLKKVPEYEFFLELENIIKRKGFDVIYIVGEGDEWMYEKFSPIYKIENLITFSQHVKSSLLYIGVDSGISHLVSYLGVKSFVIFGPTDPIVWKPIGRNLKLIYTYPDCGPCFPHVCDERWCLSEEKLLKLFYSIRI